MSKVVRSVKNVTKGYSAVQVKVRNATSNDPWGPVGSDMADIAQMTFNSSQDFYEIMDMLDKRLNDKGKNWRHVLKSLKVLDYCLHEGSELVVTWARKNIYIIKTLREFTYVDEEGRDVGQNIRVSAKELTSLLLDEERLRAERSDRRSWKSRVHGLDDGYGDSPTRPRNNRKIRNEDDDLEYKLAMEASKSQWEEEERNRRGSKSTAEEDDLAKAMKLSAEEAEAERRRKAEAAAQDDLLFDEAPAQQPQPTGWNQGYQQQGAVDWFGNLVDQQPQNTGFLNNAYSQNGFGYNNPYQQNGFDQAFQQPMQTGFNPWAQQMQQQPPEPAQQPGSNNPWASNQQQTVDLRPQPTGSNNPFASSFQRTQTMPAKKISTLSSLAEQRPTTTFTQPQSPPPPLPQPPPQPAYSFAAEPPKKDDNPHHAQLNALLASNPGLDTFGNEGQLRIPAQHTAPGTFVNSAGAGLNKLTADKTGNNPFFAPQMTGAVPPAPAPQRPLQTGPAAGGFAAANPFGRPPQQNGGQNGSLIDL